MMMWRVRINGKLKLTTKNPEEATGKGHLWWMRSGGMSLVQIFSFGIGETLVEEWLPEHKEGE